MRALLLCILVVVAACGQPGGTALLEEGPATPDGEWLLVEGAPVVEGYPITLQVADGRVGGTAACNTYGGELRTDGASVAVGDVARTEMGCPQPGVHESEAAYLERLGRVERWEVVDGRLRLVGEDVLLVFDPVEPEAEAPLTGTDWRLESLLSGTGPDGAASSTMAEATLRLDEGGTFTGTTGCNELTGTWTAEAGALRFEDVITTDVACQDGIAAQEEHVLAVLGGTPTVERSGRSLTLTAGDRGLQLRAD